MSPLSPQHNRVIYALFFIFLLALLPRGGYLGDYWCWQLWSFRLMENGLTNIYNNEDVNYPPLFIYILKGFSLLFHSRAGITANTHYLKVVPLLFDFAGAFFVLKFIKDKSQHIFYFFLLFLNPGFIYNTLIWSQVDGILACLLFISVYWAWRKKALASLIFFLLALNFKMQGIIFFPLVVLLLLMRPLGTYRLSALLKGALALAAIQVLIWLPFIWDNALGKVMDVYINSVGFYPYVSLSAYNLWYLFFPKPLETADTQVFLGLTYKAWGLGLFLITSALALWPLFKLLISHVIKKAEITLKAESIMLVAMLLPLLFFYFNTQMHERYSHPMLLFMAAYAFISGRYLPYILGSLAYFLNLESILKYYKFANYNIFLFSPYFISALYLITIIYCFYHLYKPPRFEPVAQEANQP